MIGSPLSTWQEIVEQNLEAGRTPVVSLGMGVLTPDSAMGLLALRRLTERRTGVADPTVLVGGEGSLWVMALLQRQSRRGRRRRLPIVFTGPDAGTHMASLNILAARSMPATWGASTLFEVPPGVRWLVPADPMPDALFSLERIPFAEDASPHRPSGPTAQAADWADPDIWLAYGAIGLTLGMLLVALLS